MLLIWDVRLPSGGVGTGAHPDSAGTDGKGEGAGSGGVTPPLPVVGIDTHPDSGAGSGGVDCCPGAINADCAGEGEGDCPDVGCPPVPPRYAGAGCADCIYGEGSCCPPVDTGVNCCPGAAGTGCTGNEEGDCIGGGVGCCPPVGTRVNCCPLAFSACARTPAPVCCGCSTAKDACGVRAGCEGRCFAGVNCIIAGLSC